MKRADIKRRPLADTTLAGLEAESKEYRELDGSGLYFRVKPDGGKSWQLRYKRPAGNWAWMGLGGYPEVSGAVAREKAAELRKVVSSGADPLEQKRSAKAAIDIAKARTFRAAADAWLKAKEEKGLAPSTLNKIRTYLDKDILPALGENLSTTSPAPIAPTCRPALRPVTPTTLPRNAALGSIRSLAGPLVWD